MRFGVCGIEFRNIYKNKLFYMLPSCVCDVSNYTLKLLKIKKSSNKKLISITFSILYYLPTITYLTNWFFSLSIHHLLYEDSHYTHYNFPEVKLTYLDCAFIFQLKDMNFIIIEDKANILLWRAGSFCWLIFCQLTEKFNKFVLALSAL